MQIARLPAKAHRCMKAVALGLVVVLLSSCTFVRVLNVSEVRGRVYVRVPDGSGYTKSIPPGGTVDYFSTRGGRFTATVMPDLEYRKLLNDLKAEITRRLFEERTTLTANDVRTLVERLNDVDKQLELLSRQGASCGGSIPDFETAVIVLSWDASSQNFALSCN